MTKRIDILGSFWTIGVGADPLGDQRCLHDFRRRVELASKAGFRGMGLWPVSYTHLTLPTTERV